MNRWRRLTLRDRLSLLVTGAVGAAVIVVAVATWVAVAELQHNQVSSQLQTDASAIASQPDQWLAGSSELPGPSAASGPDDHHHHRSLGPLWQILGTDGSVRGSTDALPVTDVARAVAARQRRAVQERVTVDGDDYLMIDMSIPSGGAVQVGINLDQSRHTLTTLALVLLAAAIAGIVGAALLGRAVARAGLAPVGRLTDQVEELAVTMDLTRPVAAEGADEIARLGRSVNTMLAAIDTARRAQRTLVEDAGHELRTPLTSIKTNIELLREVERHPELAHRLPPEDRAALLADLESQVGELATLTAELVELAREDTTREAAEPVDLAEVVTAAITRVRMRAPTLTFDTTLVPAPVRGRPGELERMVVNVLDNAAKWSPAHGTVRTVLSGDPDAGWTLTVTDDGPGIDEQDRPHVFDRFYRAAAARAMPGSGLGLAIVAQTAAQHAGTVTADAHPPTGTAITIHLPGA